MLELQNLALLQGGLTALSCLAEKGGSGLSSLESGSGHLLDRAKLLNQALLSSIEVITKAAKYLLQIHHSIFTIL